jgi:N6-L-threonylcarbamoyladenine synthase
MLVLGIETSCDETAAAVVRDGQEVLSNIVHSQVRDHQRYGGVVPEIASRLHVEMLPAMVQEALREPGVGWDDLDAIAVTYGPGLASSLLVGLSSARALALRVDKPLVGINHLEAHLYSVFLGPAAPRLSEVCPLVVLLVTGGNTCLVLVNDIGDYRVLGQTLDDAAGEALDKGAKLLGLGYPGGPAIESAAAGGRMDFLDLPRGLGHGRGSELVHGMRRDLCFSFSGLKTALLYYLKAHPEVLSNGALADVAASYQEAVFDALISRAGKALELEGVRHLACVGGVARNRRLRDKLAQLVREQGVSLYSAAPEYCTDNAAMIAALAGTGRAGVPVGAGPFDIEPSLGLGASAGTGGP